MTFVIQKISVFQAKTHLSRLLDEVAGGESICINKHGKRVAELRPPTPQQHTKAKFGCAKDPGFYMAPDFDEPLEEFMEFM